MGLLSAARLSSAKLDRGCIHRPDMEWSRAWHVLARRHWGPLERHGARRVAVDSSNNSKQQHLTRLLTPSPKHTPCDDDLTAPPRHVSQPLCCCLSLLSAALPRYRCCRCHRRRRRHRLMLTTPSASSHSATYTTMEPTNTPSCTAVSMFRRRLPYTCLLMRTRPTENRCLSYAPSRR